MKKFVAYIMILLSVVTVTSPAASAATGGIAGHYYYTDIVTYLRGMPISSINIGGQTLISAEAMNRYGFEVNWHARRAPA